MKFFFTDVIAPSFADMNSAIKKIIQSHEGEKIADNMISYNFEAILSFCWQSLKVGYNLHTKIA